MNKIINKIIDFFESIFGVGIGIVIFFLILGTILFAVFGLL